MADVLDLDLTLTQRPLQRRPTERLHQQISHVEQQVAAVGAVDRAGLDLPKIGDKHAVLRNVLDTAQEIAERGVQLFDDRNCRASSRVTDEDVDLVSFETDCHLEIPRYSFRHRHPPSLANSVTLSTKSSANCLQMFEDPGKIATFRPNVVDRLAYGKHWPCLD